MMRINNIPINDWPLIIGPGRNPYYPGPSPAILLMNRYDGTIKSGPECGEVIMYFFNGNIPVQDLINRWNEAEDNLFNYVDKFNPDGLRRQSDRPPHDRGTLLAALGFAPDARFPEL